MSKAPQSFENHARFVVGYHYVLGPLVLVALILSTIRVVQAPTHDTALSLVLAVALLLTAAHARIFPLGVQDRLIRLEERLRMERILPEDLRARIGEFTTEQLIGLRFASDEELPALARSVLDEGVAKRNAIKARIREWRADHQRI